MAYGTSFLSGGCRSGRPSEPDAENQDPSSTSTFLSDKFHASKELSTNMENTVIADGNLPAMCHVVCTLVATGIAGINITGSVPVTTQTPPQLGYIPEGYIGHSDVGVAYKVYDEVVNWPEAKRRCIRDGARLALIDSTTKLQYVKVQKKSYDDAHVGIIRMFDTTWVDDTTGKKLEALPWKNGFPTRDVDCAVMEFSSTSLRNLNCSSTYNYVCEIPIIIRHHRMTVN